ncbi:hypothetical protein [Parvularcula lutaonensis]|uniref:Uncharacterized protein n=1 Tax=Parvularcula lutaonensis TaxID=491923 RepID=A0ABV7MEM7_9PROT|nr:hypothetical protein [Parvularcula lutaonensis]GGY55108.1 hypothetical protein GCM10007148_26130 [Parvularcula lutaonensis]
MADRSDFQGAMLFFSAATLAAAVLIGNEGMSLPEYWDILRSGFSDYFPDDLRKAESVEAVASASLDGLGLPASLDGWLERGMAIMMTVGWSLGAMWAAIWSRIQAIALVLIAGASGEAVRESLAMTASQLGSMELAAMLLQGVAFLAASLGILGISKNLVLGKGRAPAIRPKQTQPRWSV